MKKQIIVACLGATRSIKYSHQIFDDLKHSSHLDNDPIHFVIVLDEYFRIVESFTNTKLQDISEIKMN